MRRDHSTKACDVLLTSGHWPSLLCSGGHDSRVGDRIHLVLTLLRGTAGAHLLN